MSAGDRAAERFIRDLREKMIERGDEPLTEYIEEIVRTSFIAAWVRALVYSKARWGES